MRGVRAEFGGWRRGRGGGDRGEEVGEFGFKDITGMSPLYSSPPKFGADWEGLRWDECGRSIHGNKAGKEEELEISLIVRGCFFCDCARGLPSTSHAKD